MSLTRDAACEDVAQLVTLLTESHPDPYTGTGGPLAFHRRARDIFAAIPDNGIDKADLLRLLRPLVAALHDGHTRIGLAMPVRSRSARLWLEWEVIEQELHVASVYRTEDAPLLGARLRALEAVPFNELCTRMGQVQGYDNEYQNLLLLDGRREVAHLRVDSLMHYREAFEHAAAVGAPARLGLPLEETARRAYGGDLPDDTAARIALVPSASELLHDLFTAMRDARTPNLLVDLRFCPGGNSLFALILDYYLHGLRLRSRSTRGTRSSATHRLTWRTAWPRSARRWRRSFRTAAMTSPRRKTGAAGSRLA